MFEAFTFKLCGFNISGFTEKEIVIFFGLTLQPAGSLWIFGSRF